MSFIGMVGLACPSYARRPYPPGLIEYGIDSTIDAVLMPAAGLILTGMSSIIIFRILTLLIWGLALAPLFFAQRKLGLIWSYASLIPLWSLYGLGWYVVHTFNFGH